VWIHTNTTPYTIMA